ncbi:mediator of RNA polymerase II transcription subunit 22 [Tetranychus urticae]|uniref:Mediator of RNA polymerase II transcription subunit 22 n=1 Tax=Tetranychus urticae TaxID=32264 RepID=T1JVG3_TETUR|nr:mediator of RNA polymerase II transcription subunit 22 [Tetranychus urticae]
MTTSHEATLKAYQKWLKDAIKSITDNYLEIIKLVKIDNEGLPNNSTPARAQEHYEVIVRAANMVRAQESLIKLIYQLKQFYIINDFKLINKAISNESKNFKADEIDMKLTNLRNEITAELIVLEDEYYNSMYK